MNIHPNSEQRSANGADLNALDGVHRQGKQAQSRALETPKSVLRASDLNLMTERGEEETDKSPRHETPNSIFLPPRHPDRNLLQLDARLAGLVHLPKPVDVQDALADVQLSDTCAGGQHSREPSGVEDDLVRLRIGGTEQIGCTEAADLVGNSPQPQQFIEQASANEALGVQDRPKQPTNTARHAQSLEPVVRSKAAGDQAGVASASGIHVTNQLGRPLGPSASQPPQAGFQPMMSSREKLNLANASAWRSPVRTTAAGNIGLLSSHLKLNRQLLSGTHQRSNYRDHHRDLLQERSERLEDELIQAQTTLRQKEGSLKIKIALLEQQAAQMRQEMSEAKRREEAQKNTYDQILQIIHRQLLDANLSEPSYNAILINLNYVQHILNDANKNFSSGTVTPSMKIKLDEAQAPHRVEEQEKARERKQAQEAQERAGEKEALVEKYEAKNKEFMDEIARLQVEIGTQKETIGQLEEENRELADRVAKVDGELKEQREREQKLKALHNDEMKFNEEMNTYEQQLFQSKIKELETNLTSMHNRMQIWNMTEVNVDGTSQGSQTGAAEDARSPRRPMFNHSVRLESLQNCLRKQRRSNSNGRCRRTGIPESCAQTPLKAPYIIAGGSVVAAQSSHACDRDCQTEESVFQESIQKLIKGLRAEYDAGKRQKEEENRVIREKISKLQVERENEMQTWHLSKDEQEQTISQLRGVIDRNLANYREATAELERQLEQAQRTCQKTEEDNQALKSQVRLVCKQMEKLDRIQQGETSKPRSKRAASGSPAAQATQRKCNAATGPNGRNSKTPIAAQRQRALLGKQKATNIGNGSLKEVDAMKQQLFGLKQQVQELIKQDKQQRWEGQARPLDASKSPKDANRWSRKVLQIDLTADLCKPGTSRSNMSGSRSGSSRRLLGRGTIRSRDFEDQGHDHTPGSGGRAQLAGNKESSQTTNGKARSIRAATSRSPEDADYCVAPSQVGQRQRGPRGLSLKKVHSTKAILNDVSNLTRPDSRNGASTEKGRAVCAPPPVKEKTREEGEALSSQQPRVRKHDCLKVAKRNSSQTAEDPCMKKRVAKYADHLNDRRRHMKASLKARSSSRITTVKKELAKQLEALQISAGRGERANGAKNGQSSGALKSKVVQDELRKGDASGASQTNQTGAMALTKALRNSRTSNQGFNLQTINQHIKLKEIEMEGEHGGDGEVIGATMRHRRAMKSSADLERSGESCEWGPSPGAGSSLIKNRRKMDKYSFQERHRFQSMNNDSRVKAIGAYGKAKSSRYDNLSDNSGCQMNDTDDLPVYFGDIASKKKLITNLSQKGGSQRLGRDAKKVDHGQLKQIGNGALPWRPVLAERAQAVQAYERLHRKPNSPVGYSTQPAAGASNETGLAAGEAGKASGPEARQPVEGHGNIDELLDVPGEFTRELDRQYDSLKPEVQIALSEGSQHDPEDVAQTGYISSQISPVKQEARKAAIKDMAKGSPALETRRLHDHCEISAAENPPQSLSQNNKKIQNEVGAFARLMQPVQMMQEQHERPPAGLAPHAQLSSSDSDASVGSELLHDDGEESTPTQTEGKVLANAAQDGGNERARQLQAQAWQPNAGRKSAKQKQMPSAESPGLASNKPGTNRLPSQYQLNSGHRPPGQPVYMPPDFLGKLDELFGRIQKRDQKVNKLKARNRGYKDKLDRLEEQYREACQKLEESLRRNEELELQLQKFECRLKQAQIVLNDPTDRVDLHLNTQSDAQGQSEEFGGHEEGEGKPAERGLASKKPQKQELLQVQSSIKDLQHRKSKIRQVEKSRQRSLQFTQRASPDLDNCSTEQLKLGALQPSEMSQLRVPGKPKSSRQPSQQPPGQAPRVGASLMYKRANSMSSTPNLHQFKKQFQSMSKLNKQSAVVASKNRAIPMIDLTALNQSNQSEWVDLGQPSSEDVGELDLPEERRSPTQNMSACMSQRPAFKPSPIPLKIAHSQILNGRSHDKQDVMHRSAISGNDNFLFQKPNTPLARSPLPCSGDRGSSGLVPTRLAAKTSRHFGLASRAGVFMSNGSHTCDSSTAQQQQPDKSLLSTEWVQAPSQNLYHRANGRVAESVGVFKHLDLQDAKSQASTQHTKTNFGADSSKRSLWTGDSKSSMPFSQPKKQLLAPDSSTRTHNQLQKSQESDLSVVPHKQRPSKKQKHPAQPAAAGNLTVLAQDSQREPLPHDTTFGASNTMRAGAHHKSTRSALTLTVPTTPNTSNKRSQYSRLGQSKAAFR